MTQRLETKNRARAISGGPSYHFLRGGGAIPGAHTEVLLDHFIPRGLPVVDHGDHFDVPRVVAGDAYITCDMEVDAGLEPVREKVFQVQLAHNLTGIKGSHFGRSGANLNVLPGRQILELHEVDLGDPRYVIAGYPKWDRIVAERRLQAERRQSAAEDRGLDPALPWVVFYPTGPSGAFTSNAGRAIEIYLRARRDLGPCEYLFCNHAHNDTDSDTRQALAALRALARADHHVHLIGGHATLPLLAACDLFITDVASTLLTVVSMDKPVLFIPITTIDRCREAARALQCGAWLDEVPDLRAFLADYHTPAALRELLLHCVAFDDDQNCERIMQLIVERVAAWREVVRI